MLKIYKPKLEDLYFKEKILSDEETMSYNLAWGGTIPFPKEDWEDWFNYWIVNHENKRYYRYLVNDDGDFVGEIAYHYDASYDGYMSDIIILAKYRHRGYGLAGLNLLISEAKKNGIKYLYDDIAIDNPAIKLFLKLGFIEQYRTNEIILLKKTI